MEEVPLFFGIRDSNIPPYAMWDRETFPKAISVALANYLGDNDIPLNYVAIDGRCSCNVEQITTSEVYGSSDTPFTELRFDFDSIYGPHLDLASSVPESDLVVTDPRKGTSRRLDILASVVPDASTRDLEPSRMGPEMTVRTNMLKSCALSMASSFIGERESVLEVLRDAVSDADISDWESISGCTGKMVEAIDRLESSNPGCQKPMLLQCMWRTEADGPVMDEDAMDIFVWSDFAFSRLFLESTRRPSDGGPTRPLRCAVRLFSIMLSILEGDHPDLDRIIMDTRYGIVGNREFMVNGKQSNRVMSCDRLVRPVLGASEIRCLASEGFEGMIAPERRLDTCMYYATRSIRG